MSVEMHPRLFLQTHRLPFVSRIYVNRELVDTQEEIAKAVEMHDCRIQTRRAVCLSQICLTDQIASNKIRAANLIFPVLTQCVSWSK